MTALSEVDGTDGKELDTVQYQGYQQNFIEKLRYRNIHMDYHMRSNHYTTRCQA